MLVFPVLFFALKVTVPERDRMSRASSPRGDHEPGGIRPPPTPSMELPLVAAGPAQS